MAEINDGGLPAFIDSMNGQSEICGGVVIPASDDHKNALIIFAGNLERFAMLSVARLARCKIIYLQDTESWWYQGSSLLPHLDVLSDNFLVEEIGSLRPVFFGQSSGGYASLVAATRFPEARVLACAPQIASDRAVKDAIICSPQISVQCTPEGLTNVPELWIGMQGKRPQAALLFSVSEWGNPVTSHFWMDHAHCVRMLGIPDVAVFLVANNVHAIVHRNGKAFAKLVSEIINTSDPILSMTSHIRDSLERMKTPSARRAR